MINSLGQYNLYIVNPPPPKKNPENSETSITIEESCQGARPKKLGQFQIACFTDKFCVTFHEQIISVLFKLFQSKENMQLQPRK